MDCEAEDSIIAKALGHNSLAACFVLSYYTADSSTSLHACAKWGKILLYHHNVK